MKGRVLPATHLRTRAAHATAVPTALEAHERGGGPGAARQSVLARSVIAQYTQPTLIEFPIPHTRGVFPTRLPASTTPAWPSCMLTRISAKACTTAARSHSRGWCLAA
jgi:hypothetical protein